MRNLVQEDVHVWVASLAPAEQEHDLSELHALLDEEERARAARFLFERHRRQFILSHALVRRALSEYAPVIPEAWRFHANAHRRPEVENAAGASLCFSLSHTDGLALCAVTLSAEVGVDVELERPYADDRLSLARALLHPREVAALEATAPADVCARFLELWTLKEAYVKARGLGLSLSFRDFAFTTGSGRAPEIHFDPGLEDSRSGWRFFQLRPTELHRGALAVRRAGHEALRVTQIFVDLLNAQARGCATLIEPYPRRGRASAAGFGIQTRAGARRQRCSSAWSRSSRTWWNGWRASRVDGVQISQMLSAKSIDAATLRSRRPHLARPQKRWPCFAPCSAGRAR